MSGFTDAQLANARRIEWTRRDLHLPRRAGTLALATALVESSCLRLASRKVPDSLAVSWADATAAGDHDSVGVFQQRRAWGPLLARMAASSSSRMFFLGGAAGQRGLTDFPDWQTHPFGATCQRVQVSAFPDRYGAHQHLAEQLQAAVDPA